MTHIDSPLLMGICVQCFALTNNTVLNDLLLTSLHICWEFICRINFKQEAKWPVHFHTYQILPNYPPQGLYALSPSYHQLTKVSISPSSDIRQSLALSQTGGWKIVSHFYLYFLMIGETGHLSGLCLSFIFLFLRTASLYVFVGMFFVSFHQRFSTYSVVDIVFNKPLWNLG